MGTSDKAELGTRDWLPDLDGMGMTNTKLDYYRWIEHSGNPLSGDYFQHYGRMHYFDPKSGIQAPEKAVDRFVSRAADPAHPLADMPGGWAKLMLTDVGGTQDELSNITHTSQSTVSRYLGDRKIGKEASVAVLTGIFEVARGKGDDLAAGYLGYLGCRPHERGRVGERDVEEQEILLIADTIKDMAAMLDMEGLLALHTMAMRLAAGRQEDFRLTNEERARQESELEELWPRVRRAHDRAWQLAINYPSGTDFRSPPDGMT